MLKCNKNKIETKGKGKPHQKISNDFIENTIRKNNIVTMKIIYYISAIIKKENINKEDINKIVIDTKKMIEYTNLNIRTIKENLINLQKTSIYFYNEEEEEEEYISIIPKIKILYNKNFIEVDIYKKISNLICEVKKKYSFIDTRELMKLKSKHSIRMLAILYMINNFNAKNKKEEVISIPKRKKYNLEEINELFGTRYKTWNDINKSIFKKCKEEINQNCNIKFDYQADFESIGQGRPKFKNVIIDIIK